MIPGFLAYQKRYNVASNPVIMPGLARMEQAMAALNNPHKKLRVIHVAGTNGKGSTVSFLRQIAQANGQSVGTFMSPAITDVHDQIQLNGVPISAAQMGAIFSQLANANLDGVLTEFELLTVIAIVYFAEQQVDIALFEAGMGGLEDSTNIVTADVAIITSIALEHTAFLGTTLAAIASHKAGIIKPSTQAVIGDLPLQAMPAIKAQTANYLQINRDFTATQYGDFQLPIIKLAMRGEHQQHNMALAVMAYICFAKRFALSLNKDKIITALAQTTMPARFEEVRPQIFFDGAHNPASVEKLVATIQQQFPTQHIKIVMGILADKDVPTVLRLLETVSDDFTFLQFANERAMAAQAVANLSHATLRTTELDAMHYIKALQAAPNEVIIVTGSLYLLASLRTAIN